MEQNLVGNCVERCCDGWADPYADNAEVVPKDHQQSHGNAKGKVGDTGDDCSGSLLTRGSNYRGSDALSCIKNDKNVESDPGLADLCLNFWIICV